MIQYKTGFVFSIDEAQNLYRHTSLGERRPVEDAARFQKMFENVNLIVSAWDGSLLVGVCRSFSDFSYFTYISDLLVRDSHQKKGIGESLLKETEQLSGKDTKLVLLSAPAAHSYYARLGFKPHPRAWILE